MFPDIETKVISVTYRHSRQLNELAKDIVRLFGNAEALSVLPEKVDSEGVPPVLALKLSAQEDVVKWLGARIVEIEHFTQRLPTIAVLVNKESDVQPIADALSLVLEVHNMRVVPCLNGQSVGQENDIRVFDVQHIKGLEFEAVFFVGVDQLATSTPKLFDKFLYVGATRAATYLGLTCSGATLPAQIKNLERHFVSDWSKVSAPSARP